MDNSAMVVNHLLTDTDLVFGGRSPRLATVYARFMDSDPRLVLRLIITHLTLYTAQANLKITPLVLGEPPVAALERTAEELFSLYPFWTVYEVIYFIHRMKNGFYVVSEWNYNHSNVMKSAIMFEKERRQQTAALYDRQEKAKKAAQDAQHAREVELAMQEYETRSQAMYGRKYHDLSIDEQRKVRMADYENRKK